VTLRLLIAPDKFKGTLSASAAADAIARGWLAARPQDSVELLPITDGGDGFGEVLGSLLGAGVRTAKTVDAAHRPLQARWRWAPAKTTAIIESADVIGLTMLPQSRFHPFQLDTMGLGELILKVSRSGARRCWLGIGGSATNDGGFGLARGLGWRFLDRAGKPITQWVELTKLQWSEPPKRDRLFEELLVAVDVQNPLLGRRGATRIYGPQKGLREKDFSHAEACLSRLAAVTAETAAVDCSRLPGAGAAGGLGFGLTAFAGGSLTPGFALFARQARLPAHVKSADLVITGEGAVDRSTVMGKGVGELARICFDLKKPCIALAGITALKPKRSGIFKDVRALEQITSLAQAKAQPALWLEKLAQRVASDWGGD